MDIKLIRNQGCHIWQVAEIALKEALVEAGLPQDYEIVVVENDQQAKQYKFFGSPQITINGVDIDPMAQKMGEYKAEGCRIYMWPPAQRASGSESKMYEYPPKEMILEAIRNYGKAT